MNMNRDLMQKMLREEKLTAEEQLQLDALLEKQAGTQPLLQQLDEDTPSMAWRSALNERLHAVTPAPSRPRFAWLRWAPLVGAVAAGAVVFTMMNKPVQPSPQSVANTPEAVLVQSHLATTFAMDTGSVDGNHLNGAESETAPVTWTAEELGSF